MLNGAHVQNDLFPLDGRSRWQCNAVVYHPYPLRLHAEHIDHLARGELRYRDDAVASGRGIPRLFREPAAELGRRVFAGQDEQVVESGHRTAQARIRQPLIQAVKEIRRSGSASLAQQETPGVARQAFTERAQETVRPIAKCEPVLGMRASQTMQHLARIHPYPGQIRAYAISRIERDVQLSILYSLSLR